MTSCLGAGPNISWERTSAGIIPILHPCGEDVRREMPAGIPEGMFRDAAGCNHILPFQPMLCERSWISGAIPSTYEQAADGALEGAQPATATLTNTSPYDIDVLIIRQIGAVSADVRAGWNLSIGFNADTASGMRIPRLACLRNFSKHWPTSGVNLAGSNEARVTFAYLAILNRVPEPSGMDSHVAWLAADSSRDDHALWDRIATLNDGAEPNLQDCAIQPQQWIYKPAEPLAPGESITSTTFPYVRLVENGDALNFGSFVMEDGYGTFIFGWPTARASQLELADGSQFSWT